MTPTSLEGAAQRHYRRASSITRRVTEVMLEAWKTTGPAGFRDRLPQMAVLLATGQLAQVLESAQYLEQVAAAQGLPPAPSVLRPSGLVGRTAAGGDLTEVLELPSIRVSALVTSGVDGGAATDSGAAMLARMVSNEVTQAGNNATQIGVAGNPGFRGYIRMMKPPSCGRCAVMAGSWWEWNDGFPRHPGCDCIHVPAADRAAATNGKPPWSANLEAKDPKTYFDSLSEANQDRYFGKAQADAIRGGANVTRTVNANARAAGLRAFDSGSGPAGPRLTPKQVFAQAGDDRDAAVRLLTDNGYLEPVSVPKMAVKPWTEPVPGKGQPPAAVQSLRRAAKTKGDARAAGIADALVTYTQEGAAYVNHKLRTGKYVDFYKIEFVKPKTDDTLRGLDRLFEDRPDLTTSRGDMTLWRGIDQDLVDRLQIGDVFEDRGYMSTGTGLALARLFGFRTNYPNVRGAILKIRAPKGTRMVNLGRPNSAASPDALEMVLQRGTRLRVISRRNLDGGGIELEMEIVE